MAQYSFGRCLADGCKCAQGILEDNRLCQCCHIITYHEILRPHDNSPPEQVASNTSQFGPTSSPAVPVPSPSSTIEVMQFDPVNSDNQEVGTRSRFVKLRGPKAGIKQKPTIPTSQPTPSSSNMGSTLGVRGNRSSTAVTPKNKKRLSAISALVFDSPPQAALPPRSESAPQLSAPEEIHQFPFAVYVFEKLPPSKITSQRALDSLLFQFRRGMLASSNAVIERGFFSFTKEDIKQNYYFHVEEAVPLLKNRRWSIFVWHKVDKLYVLFPTPANFPAQFTNWQELLNANQSGFDTPTLLVKVEPSDDKVMVDFSAQAASSDIEHAKLTSKAFRFEKGKPNQTTVAVDFNLGVSALGSLSSANYFQPVTVQSMLGSMYTFTDDNSNLESEMRFLHDRSGTPLDRQHRASYVQELANRVSSELQSKEIDAIPINYHICLRLDGSESIFLQMWRFFLNLPEDGIRIRFFFTIDDWALSDNSACYIVNQFWRKLVENEDLFMHAKTEDGSDIYFPLPITSAALAQNYLQSSIFGELQATPQDLFKTLGKAAIFGLAQGLGIPSFLPKAIYLKAVTREFPLSEVAHFVPVVSDILRCVSQAGLMIQNRFGDLFENAETVKKFPKDLVLFDLRHSGYMTATWETKPIIAVLEDLLEQRLWDPTEDVLSPFYDGLSSAGILKDISMKCDIDLILHSSYAKIQNKEQMKSILRDGHARIRYSHHATLKQLVIDWIDATSMTNLKNLYYMSRGSFSVRPTKKYLRLDFSQPPSRVHGSQPYIDCKEQSLVVPQTSGLLSQGVLFLQLDSLTHRIRDQPYEELQITFSDLLLQQGRRPDTPLHEQVDGALVSEDEMYDSSDDEIIVTQHLLHGQIIWANPLIAPIDDNGV